MRFPKTKKLSLYIILCFAFFLLYLIPSNNYAQSFENFSSELETMGIDTEEFSERENISRYELTRLLNAVECIDCVHAPIFMIDRYTNPFWSDFRQQPGKDFWDINFQWWLYRWRQYYYCVAYVWENNYMRWYPEETSPICAGLFCGARNTNYAEFIQVVINVLSNYIYQNYRANWSEIANWTNELVVNSYPDRYLDDGDKDTIQNAVQECPQWECTIQDATAFKTYIKYCMFNLDQCNMRTFGQITQAYWPVSELNILYNQDIIDVQWARNIDIYSNVDGQTALDIFYKLYTNIQCNFDDDYDCDGIPNAEDNCPYHYNPSQTDTDGDGVGDVCDDDIDGDGVKNPIGIVDETGRINIKLLEQSEDNCIFTPNPDQTDSNNNWIGDACIEDSQWLWMYIAIDSIGTQAPLTTTVNAITRGTIIGEIERNMGDGTIKQWQAITHTYTNPWLYVINAYAQWINNNAVAKTTIIVWQATQQQRAIQIQANRITSNTATDITFSANTIGDVEYIQRDFWNNIRINRSAEQSITRSYTQAGSYPVTARAFKGNTLLATSRISIGIGTEQGWSQLISQRWLRTNKWESIILQTQRNPNIPIREIERDMGDGTKIRNTNTSLIHNYNIAWPRVIQQTIYTQDNRQFINYITVYIQDPVYSQSFAKNFVPNTLVAVPWDTVEYFNTNIGDTPPESNYIQRFTPTISTRYSNTNQSLLHRYNNPWVYFPSNTQHINQCLFLESQATVVIEQQDICVDIMRSWRANQYCDMDWDGIPDICDDDIDGDGVKNLIWLVLFDNPDCSIDERNINHDLLREHIQWICTLDNCPFTQNPNQEDLNRNGIGDICEESLWNIIRAQANTTENINTIKDSDGDGIPDSEDACPTIPWWYNSVDWCPVIWAELACPTYLTESINQIDIPRCPLNTRLCNDNLCHEDCEDFGGDRFCNNDGVCDPLESCNCPDCMDKQDRCQNGLKCGENNWNNVCIVDPTPEPPYIPSNPTPNCTDPTRCIQISPIIPTTCNQCPCQFADFASEFIIGDKIRAQLRDVSYQTLYRYSSPYIITE